MSAVKAGLENDPNALSHTPFLRGTNEGERTKLPDLPSPIEVQAAFRDDLELNSLLPGLVQGEPTALLLDTNNLFHSSREMGFRIDYVKLRKIFASRCDLRTATAFSAVDHERGDPNGWLRIMTKGGYKLITQPVKRYIDHRGTEVMKGNMDIQLTVAALSLSPAFMHVIIGTCDGDFVPLVEKLREGGIRKVSVLGLRNPTTHCMSTTLALSADNFYDLAALQRFVSLPPREVQ